MIAQEIFKICSEKDFKKLCMNLFEIQTQQNPVYNKYCKTILKNKQPNSIYEIPFLPIEFFKTNQIIIKNKKSEKTFISSGTSGTFSKHFIADLEIYKNSFRRSFEKFYGDITEYCILSLLPNYRKKRNSSLIYMVDDLIKNSQHPKSGFYLDNYEKLSTSLKKLENKGQKTILFGVSYALIDLARQFPQKLKHTIIIETGGTKGIRKNIIKEELHNILKNSFSLKKIHSEYGMTELLSQSYSNGDNIFQSPAWKRIIIRDVNDPLTIIGNNKTGGINVIDLANIYSCPFIATQDLGKTYEDGSFSLLGRFDNSDVRGCNLLIE